MGLDKNLWLRLVPRKPQRNEKHTNENDFFMFSLTRKNMKEKLFSHA